MINALRYELVRLRTLRSTWLLLAGGLALQFLVAWMYAGHGDMTARQRFVSSFSDLSLVLVTLFPTAVAVASFGHEYRYRTITTTMVTLRSRGKIFAAKLVTAAATAAGVGAGLVAVTLAADAAHGATPPAWRVGQVLAAVVVYTALSALVGLGIAAVTRNAIIAMVTAIGFPTILEGLLLIGARVSPGLLPYRSTSLMITPQAGAHVWAMPLPLAGLALGLLTVGAVLFAQRDA